MKRQKAFSFFIITLVFVLAAGWLQEVVAKDNGAPSGNTGSPGDGQDCAHVSCHAGSSTPKDGLITTDVPASGYLAGNTYLINVTIDEVGVTKFGFQASPQNTAGDVLGTMEIINATDTKFVGGGKYITHTLTGTAGTDTRTWTFKWTPEEATGDVTFYVAVNASNNDDHATGDHIYTSSVTMAEDPDNIPLTVEQLNKIRFDMVNPVTESLQLSVETPVNSGIEIMINDMNGVLISRQQFNSANGEFSIPMEDAAPGIYFVTIQNATDQITKTFVKI